MDVELTDEKNTTRYLKRTGTTSGPRLFSRLTALLVSPCDEQADH